MELGKDLVIKGIEPSLSIVYYFKNIEHGDDAKPHYHIAIPTADGGYVLLVMFTTKIEQKEEHYSLVNQKALASLVYAKESEICFLTQDSVIDCNQPIYKTYEELGAIALGVEYRKADLTEGLVSKIKEAIQDSPVVRRNIKKSLI